jgi:hypothetical protein
MVKKNVHHGNPRFDQLKTYAFTTKITKFTKGPDIFDYKISCSSCPSW